MKFLFIIPCFLVYQAEFHTFSFSNLQQWTEKDKKNYFIFTPQL